MSNHTGYEVECSANRSRTYRVAFSAKNEVQSVRLKVYTSNVHHHWRMLWNLSYGDMTTTVACAVRAAIAKRKAYIERISKQYDEDPNAIPGRDWSPVGR